MIEAKIVDTTFMHSDSIAYLGSENIKWLHEFDAGHNDIVFFTDDMLEIAQQITCGRKIAMLLEPPAIKPHTYQHIMKHAHLFDYILTFSRELHFQFTNKCLWFPPSTTWINNFELNPDKKTKFMSMIASSKTETTGQKLREEIIQGIIGEHHMHIDVFGRGRGKELDRKEDGLTPYMFSIVVENEKYDDYFTEKICDCFATGTIPIYYGTDHIGDYFDDHGIIPFENSQQLEAIIGRLRFDSPKNTINKYYGAMSRNFFETVKSYKSSDDYIFTHYPFLFEKCKEI